MIITKRKKIVVSAIVLLSAVIAIALNLSTPKGGLKALELRWKISMDDEVIICKADEGIVYFSCYMNGKAGVCAVNDKTGNDVWMKQGRSLVDAKYGLVYCGDLEGGFYAYDGKTGKDVWKHDIKGFNYWPLLFEYTVYFTDTQNNPVVLNAMTGEEISLSAELPKGRFVTAEGNMYFSNSDYVLAIDKETFTEKWCYRKESLSSTFEAVLEEKAFFSEGGTLHAIDAGTGRQVWKAEMKNGQISGTTTGQNMVYCGNSDETVYAFDIDTGREKWRTKVKGCAWLCRTIYYEGYIYYATNKGILYVIDAKTGEKSAMFKMEKGEMNSLEISDGFIYFGKYSQKQRVGDYGEVYGVEIVR